MLINAVAPFAGAWIEMNLRRVQRKSFWVAPFAGAWIEIILYCPYCAKDLSLPSRERGLKSLYIKIKRCWNCRSLRGSVDWNKWNWILVWRGYSRSLRGSVDWNKLRSKVPISIRSRSLRGSVDWNTIRRPTVSCLIVAPFAGAWIEITINMK